MSVPPPNGPASGPSDPYANGPVPPPQGPGGPIPSGPGGPVGAPVSKTKWIVQLVVTLVFCDIIAAILAIIGLVKADSDTALANKLYKIGWIVFAIVLALQIIGGIIYGVAVVNAINSDPSIGTN